VSWIRKRPLLSCALLALSLRAGLAGLTEFAPIFPAYYYTDAELMDKLGWDMAQAWSKPQEYLMPGSPSQRSQTFLLACIYRVFGHRPLVAKLINALFGALIALLLFHFLRPVFGEGPALGSAALSAVWPSHVFFTSQNFKDAWAIFLCYLALGGFVRAMASREGRDSWAALTGFLALILVGFLRAYLMLALACVLLLCLSLALLRRQRTLTPLILCLAAALLAPLAYLRLSKAVFTGPLAAPQEGRSDPTNQLDVIPAAYDPNRAAYVKPLSPQGIAEFRRLRQLSDQDWAEKQKNRQIGTQLFYGLRFETWLDVLLFLPKGMFYVLFMPLPFVYPLGHNLGKILASLENLLLLGLALAGLVGFLKGQKTLERWTLFLFFLAMAAGSALLEFDLGSATRHRLLYLPMLFPFALSVRSPRAPGQGRLKVFEVLECGGPGGTGNQVAAICDGLDPKRFRVGLVFASRGTDPEKYRARAHGAEKAFHIPEMVREISPLQDLKALIKLYLLLREEAPEVVHAHSSKAGVLARLAARLAGVPRIFYSPRGYAFLQQDRSWASRELYRLLERSVSWIGEIAAVSPSEAELARGLSWGKTVHLVTDPCLWEIPEQGPPEHPGTVVGSCGRLAAARNPEAFVNLAQRLTDSRNNLRCLWIGGGPEEGAVRRHLENMNLLSKVEVTGWLEPEEARERLKGLDILVHYSRWDALPNAVLEAMALSLPVIASDLGGNRDAVLPGVTGLLAGSEKELLEHTLRLVDDPELRRRMGQAGRARVLKEFSPAEALARLEALYQGPSPV